MARPGKYYLRLTKEEWGRLNKALDRLWCRVALMESKVKELNEKIKGVSHA